MLEYLYIENNNLSGPFSFLLTIPKLRSLHVSKNEKLIGNLNSLINSGTSQHLQYLLLEGINLVGSFNDDIFSLPSLTTVVLSNNCITGSIPESICTAKNLTYFILDGAHTGSGCKRTKSAFDLRPKFSGITFLTIIKNLI